jgi:hypothetical protein
MNYSKGFNNNTYPYNPYSYNNRQMPVMGMTCMNGMPYMTNTPGMPNMNMPEMPIMDMPMPFIPDSQMPEMPDDFMPDGDMPALPAMPDLQQNNLNNMMMPRMPINCQELIEFVRAMGCMDEMNSTEPTAETE